MDKFNNASYRRVAYFITLLIILYILIGWLCVNGPISVSTIIDFAAGDIALAIPTLVSAIGAQLENPLWGVFFLGSGISTFSLIAKVSYNYSKVVCEASMVTSLMSGTIPTTPCIGGTALTLVATAVAAGLAGTYMQYWL
ncbi:hypothetical protein V1514DRAFT_321791 [Lipomyces japonicus]|uniref:uncharacterized protein n=1 Tax=Lipomyces japonicus TaxID=56871 RepID=UPI0034CFCDE1